MENQKNNAKNAGLVLLGAAVGAGLGILFAPKSGKETRENVKDWLKTRREKGTLLLESIRERFPAKNQLTAALKAGKQAYFKANGNHKVERDEVAA